MYRCGGACGALRLRQRACLRYDGRGKIRLLGERAGSQGCVSAIRSRLALCGRNDADTMLDVAAVTLEGTVIHKSGLMTGGKSTHDNSKKWDEKDVQGT